MKRFPMAAISPGAAGPTRLHPSESSFDTMRRKRAAVIKKVIKLMSCSVVFCWILDEDFRIYSDLSLGLPKARWIEWLLTIDY